LGEGLGGDGVSSFKREERYIVLKLSDLTDDEYNHIEDYLEKCMIERRECVVVESDWPIYDEVWKMIEKIENEERKVLMGEVSVEDQAVSSFAEFDIMNQCDPEIFTAKDWEESVQKGWYNQGDGRALWGTSTHYNYDHSGFSSQPANATHVHWFPK
jgi:hypothetical protein